MSADRRAAPILFISHSSKDTVAAGRLHAVLIDKGYDPKQIFLDDDEQSGIDAGTKWEQVLYDRLKDCQAFVVLCSPNWRDSRWCFAELVYAKMSGKEIFPVVIGDGDLGDIVDEHQAVFVNRDGDLAYERLCTALNGRHLGPHDHLPWPNPEVKDEAGMIDACPYPGLFAFDERYAAVYFGREPEIKTVLEQLNEMRRKGEPRLLMIVGGSGSGKSSLLKAGVLPRLKHRTVESDWLVLPTLRYGDLPYSDNAFFQALAENVVRKYAATSSNPPNAKLLTDQFSNSDRRQAVDTFWDAVHDLSIARGAPDATVLLGLDQFEELLAPAAGVMANDFLAFLKAIAERPNRRLLVIGTMRSDYLDVYEHHTSALTAPLFLPWRLEPFPRARIADVIVKPARRVHLDIDDDLLEVLKQDSPTADALPLLAFTLRDLHKKCAADGRLQLSEYVSTGGMEGSIRTAAERIIPKESLSKDVAAAVRLAFVKHLAQVNEKDEFVRRTATWSEIDEAARPILSRFVSERLLVKTEHDGQVQIEVAHEAMLRCWDSLNDWLRTSADILRWRRDVRRDQESDRKNGRQWAGLSPAQLEIAREWRLTRRDELSDDEVSWIQRGIRRQRLRLSAGVAVLLIFLVLSLLSGWLMFRAQQSQGIAVSSLETQLKMFTEPTKLAGTIAAAVSDREPASVQKAFELLTNNETPMAKTPAIETAIRNLGSTIQAWSPAEKQSWNPEEEPTSENVRQAALGLAHAVREGWEKQSVQGQVKAMTLDVIVRPTYDRAIAVTRRIAMGPPTSEDISEFEKLYWGELVFLETEDVERRMVAFRRKLRGFPDSEQIDLKKEAENLKGACDSALALSRG